MRRRADDDRPAVEFLDATVPLAAGSGDELSTPPVNRARWYLAVSAAVLVAGALIAGKVSDGTGGATLSPSAPTTTPAMNSIPEPTLDPAQCPGPTPCAASRGVPLTVAAALLDAFPGAKLGRSSTVYLQTGGLWFREITGRAGTLDILVRVQRPDRGTPVIQSGYDHGVAFVRQLEHGFLVQVQVEGPRSELPSITNLYGLAADERLLDLG